MAGRAVVGSRETPHGCRVEIIVVDEDAVHETGAYDELHAAAGAGQGFIASITTPLIILTAGPIPVTAS
jgi:hypothetical protein